MTKSKKASANASTKAGTKPPDSQKSHWPKVAFAIYMLLISVFVLFMQMERYSDFMAESDAVVSSSVNSNSNSIEKVPSNWQKLNIMDQLEKAGLIDAFLDEGAKEDFEFQGYWDGEDPDNWWVIALPKWPDYDNRRFFVDSTGVIRCETNGIPNHNSPILGSR